MTVPALPDEAARALYRELLAGGGTFDPAEVASRAPEALEQLRAASLVVPLANGEWATTDPRVAAGRLRAKYHRVAMEILNRSEEPAQVIEELAQAYERTPPRAAGERLISHVGGLSEIQQRLENAALEAAQEILTMQPGGARPAEVLPKMYRDVQGAHARGIELRGIYQPGARSAKGTVDYAVFATSLGARIRILDEPFKRLMVFDRKVAVIAAHSTYYMATFVEDPVLVGVLVEQFERDWSRAERVRWDPPGPEPLRELLAQGLTQAAIAKRLGLSERTVAGQIARLREEYDADTLFQLGWLMQGAS